MLKLLKNPQLLQTGLLINGKWLNRKDQKAVINPATGETIAHISMASKKDIQAAIDSAQEAFNLWSRKTAQERSQILKKWFQLIHHNLDDLAKIVTIECGKPLTEAENEVKYAASFLEWFSEEAVRADGEIIPANNANQRALIIKQPVGVCAAITPWNFPSAMLTRKVAPALASGCAIVARPSSQTPFSANALGYLALEAGLPSGLFNIINGDSELVANTLCNSQIVKKLSFTGSTAVGIELYQKSAQTMKRLSLELGGNAPFIIFDDADLDKAVDGVIQSKFRNAGQTCVCANRIFIAKKIEQQFISKLSQKIKQLKVGNGLERGVQIGPLINSHALEHAKSLIKDSIKHGAKLVYGGKSDQLGNNFFMPTLLTECTPNMRIFAEEIFAPILAIYAFEHEHEVVELANKTPFGLASYFYATDVKRIFNVAEQLQYGMVGVNTGLISAANVPFGGIKQSGFGHEGGHLGLDEYLNTKYICLDLK